MKLSEEQSWIITSSLLVLATLGIGVALHVADTVLIPFVMAIFVTTAIAPLVDIQVLRFRWPKAIAVVNTMGLVLFALFLFILLMAATGHSMVTSMQEYPEMIGDFAKDMTEQVEVWQGTEWGERIGINEIELTFDPTLLSKPATLLAQKIGALVGNILSIAVLTSIFVAFILAGRDSSKLATGIYKEIDTKIRRYIMAKVIYSAATGILVWIILAILQLPMASLFGLLAFFLNFIPSIGSIIAWLLPVPIAILSPDHGPWAVSAVILFPGLVQLGIGNGLEPKMMGDDLELHPVTILLALSVWGLIWGIVGMVLAIPITASIRVVLMRFEATRPAGDILAGRLPDA